MARALVQATLPHRQQKETNFERTNGVFTLLMIGHPKIGLPYGSLPRLVLCWLSTEAVRKRTPHIELGDSLSSFMHNLDLAPTGGRWGSIPRLRNQCQRLFSTSVSCLYEHDDKLSIEEGYRLVTRHMVWWDPKDPTQQSMFPSFVDLSLEFYTELIEHPVPISIETLKALRSPLAIDIYCWTTFRMSYLRRQTTIPWEALQAQFGADYGRARDFRNAFLVQLRTVAQHYPAARYEPTKAGLVLHPSKTHILRKTCG